MENASRQILIIDDGAVSRAVIGRMLEKLDFKVITAENGMTGLELYHRHAPDLVMVDLFMPDIDGFEVLATVRAQSPETPVILISATDRIKDVIRALRLGAWDFITKPVKDSVFLENTISRAFEKAALTVENRLYREKIQTIINTVPCGIVVVESAGQTIMEANPMAAEMVGLPVDAMLGKKCPGFIFPEEPQACVDDGPDATCTQSEHILLKSDGSRVPIHKTITWTTIEDRECTIESFVDISEHKQAQLELIERKKMQGVLEMAGAVCHEMNQPLQVISGFCDLIMLDLEETNPIFEKFKRIRSQVGEMGRITSKLMGITQYRTKAYLTEQIIDIDESSDSDH